MNFIHEFSEYVNGNHDIDVCLLLGSYADHLTDRSDDLSDFDLFMVTQKSDYYLHKIHWLNFYDKPALYFNDPISLGIGTELRVIFSDETVADIAIVDSNQFEKLKKNKVFCERVLGRGLMEIKNQLGEDVLKYSTEEFLDQDDLEYQLNRKIDEFWIDMYNIYKYVARKDYFSAKYTFDRRITKLLIFVLEESTKMKKSIDVMFNGRCMDKWLDAEDLLLMDKIFSSTSQAQLLRAINTAILIFESKIDYIFEAYNYTKQTSRNKIVDLIKDKLNGAEV